VLRVYRGLNYQKGWYIKHDWINNNYQNYIEISVPLINIAKNSIKMLTNIFLSTQKIKKVIKISRICLNYRVVHKELSGSVNLSQLVLFLLTAPFRSNQSLSVEAPDPSPQSHTYENSRSRNLRTLIKRCQLSKVSCPMKTGDWGPKGRHMIVSKRRDHTPHLTSRACRQNGNENWNGNGNGNGKGNGNPLVTSSAPGISFLRLCFI